MGYDSVADLKTCRLADLYCDPKDRDTMLALLKKERVLTGFEFQLKHKDGTRVWFLANMSLVEDEGREVIEATAVDLIDRKRAEEVLQASESRYRMLFEHNVAAVTIRHAAKVFHAQPRSRLQGIASGSGIKATGGVPAVELHGFRLRAYGKGRYDFLPECTYLFRSADAGEDPAKTDVPPGAGRLSFCWPR
jgi:hypothetical protein